MTEQQLQRGNEIEKRIVELLSLKHEINYHKDETKIEGYRIPKDSKEVIVALSQKEIDELHEEFKKL